MRSRWTGRRFRWDILIYGSADLIRALMFVNLQGQIGNGNRLLEKKKKRKKNRTGWSCLMKDIFPFFNYCSNSCFCFISVHLKSIFFSFCSIIGGGR